VRRTVHLRQAGLRHLLLRLARYVYERALPGWRDGLHHGSQLPERDEVPHKVERWRVHHGWWLAGLWELLRRNVQRVAERRVP
jgi:hypothetical protein